MYPYFHYLIQHGTAIYSRFPILDKGLVEFGTKTNSCLWVDLLVQGRKLRVYSVHLQSNRITKELEQITDDEDEQNSEKSVRSVKCFANIKTLRLSVQSKLVC